MRAFYRSNQKISRGWTIILCFPRMSVTLAFCFVSKKQTLSHFLPSQLISSLASLKLHNFQQLQCFSSFNPMTIINCSGNPISRWDILVSSGWWKSYLNTSDQQLVGPEFKRANAIITIACRWNDKYSTYEKKWKDGWWWWACIVIFSTLISAEKGFIKAGSTHKQVWR